MGLRLNRTMLLQTDADSGALTMLAAVVHRPGPPGSYAGTVYRGDQAVGEFTLRVLDEAAPLQIHVDLATQRLRGESGRPQKSRLDDPCCDDDQGSDSGEAATFTVGRDGHALFHVSTGAGGFAVQLAGVGPKDRREDSETWDSRELREGDLFAITLLRPGAYRVANEAAQAEAKISLAYPERGKTAYRPPDAMHIAVTKTGFQPASIALQPMQGQVYEVQVPSRIRISLTEPDDGPQRADGPRPARYTLLRRPAARGAPVERDAAPGREATLD